MTPAQKQALGPYRKKMRQDFADAAAGATTPGGARTWFVPYLATVLKVYGKLTTKSVDGKALSKALAKDPRTAFFRLLRSSKRNSKTRSRWAAALVHAYKTGVSPDELPKWPGELRVARRNWRVRAAPKSKRLTHRETGPTTVRRHSCLLRRTAR